MRLGCNCGKYSMVRPGSVRLAFTNRNGSAAIWLSLHNWPKRAKDSTRVLSADLPNWNPGVSDFVPAIVCFAGPSNTIFQTRQFFLKLVAEPVSSWSVSGKRCPGLPWGGGEVSSVGLRLAADRVPGVDLFQMDARQIPFENQFDVIGAFDVLEHMGDDELVLLASVLGSAPMGWYSSNRFAAFLPLEQDR